MANDFMKNANKVVLNGEEVSFNNLAEPIVVAEETVEEVNIEKKPSKKAKKEEKVEEPTVEEINETTEETVVEETPTDEE